MQHDLYRAVIPKRHAIKRKVQAVMLTLPLSPALMTLEVININYDSVLSASIDGRRSNQYILPKVKVEVIMEGQ